MKQTALAFNGFLASSIRVNYPIYFLVFIAGLIGPLGFAPFHLPGLIILSLALLFHNLLNCSIKQSFALGFTFGLGYFGFGVSWVIVSIHDYGQLNYFLAGLTTLLFITYLSLFPAALAYVFKLLYTNNGFLSLLLFSSLWCFSELLRSKLFSGFPWLLVGLTQLDTPLKHVAPVIGLNGLSFLCAFLAALLVMGIRELSIKRYFYFSIFVLMFILPEATKSIDWTQVKKEPVSIGVVQANLSMRDKWDEALFWKLLKYYEQTIKQLLGKQLIILPESAIPLPASYLEDYLNKINKEAIKANSSLILGILQATDDSETEYYNSIISLGAAQGEHTKYQLVPFGEYIPKPFVSINRWLGLPEPNIVPGKPQQELIKIAQHPIASLICYEIAYPNLLRLQMPLAQWIVSISDSGWFGHSLATYQQLQMAQMLSLLTGRFQVVVNNDGLSSIINTKGNIINSLPPFSSGILQGEIYPAEGTTPWVYWSEYPSIVFCSLSLIFMLFLRLRRITKQ
jgi:apolipoprotein N-acyltransferase